jgi:putative restriction endonuclease
LHLHDGRRSPHKPLLALLALGRLIETGSSKLAWSEVELRLAYVLAEFGPPSKTGPAQSAAYPFTRLRSDGVWQLDSDVPMDNVGPLRAGDVTGSFTALVEADLQRHPDRALATARALATSHFPESMVADVLLACGLDPGLVLGTDLGRDTDLPERRRSAAWTTAVLATWDRQCAFCGYDGQLGGGSVGLEAAHVRWWSFGGPDDPDNVLALCSLHHKLFDRGVLGLDTQVRLLVSTAFSARTEAGKRIYELHGQELRPRPGTPLPAAEHVCLAQQRGVQRPETRGLNQPRRRPVCGELAG